MRADSLIRYWLGARSPLQSLCCAVHYTTSGMSSVSRVEDVIGRKAGVAVGTFVDCDGAFNNTLVVAVSRGVREKVVSEAVFCWISGILRHWVLKVTTIEGSVWRGFPQGGVLSPLLWCWVVDKSVKELNEAGFYVQAYADFMLILMPEL